MKQGMEKTGFLARTSLKMANISEFDNFQSQCIRHIQSATSFYFINVILSSVMTVVTIVLSCTFIGTMLFQRLIHKSISNKLLVVLSMVDFLQGVSTWPLTGANNVIFYRTGINCVLLKLLYLLGYHLVYLTVGTIITITLEQYLAITHPYFYISTVTFKRLFIPMLVLTSLSSMINILGEMKINQALHKNYKLALTIVGSLGMMALAYMHVKIMKCASRVAARITDTNREEGKKIKSKAKAAKSGLIVLLSTLACYLPYLCYTIYVKASGGPTPSSITFGRYPTEMISLFSSLVDPIIYYWRMKSLRKATKDMFTSLCKCQRVEHRT